MSDPISGDAIRQTPKVGDQVQQPQEQVKSTGPTKFDSVMEEKAVSDEQVREALETDLETSIQRMPHAEKVRLERELETKVMKMDRAEQTSYFASRIEQNDKILAQLQRDSQSLEDGPWKTKLMGTLDWISAESGKTNSFLDDIRAGKNFTQQELLEIQIRSHRTGQVSSLLRRAVSLSASGMKTIFQTNV